MIYVHYCSRVWGTLRNVPFLPGGQHALICALGKCHVSSAGFIAWHGHFAKHKGIVHTGFLSAQLTAYGSEVCILGDELLKSR